MNAVANPKASTEVHDPDPIVCHVNHALRASGYRGLSGVQCKHDDGVITLIGNVGSYFLKQIAQTVAGRVQGVVRIDNQLRVS